MNVSLKDQLQDVLNTKFPFVRRDGAVRACILHESQDTNTLLIATIVVGNKPAKWSRGANEPRAYNVPTEATIRAVDGEYFDNNFWEGKN